MQKLRILLCFALFSIINQQSRAGDLSETMETVEKIRGLRFSRQVTQKSMARSELRAYLDDQVKSGLEMTERDYVSLLETLFLLDRSPRPLRKLVDLYESQVLAFYDPLRHIYFSLAEPPPGVERNETVDQAVAIHEITHALQDQRFQAGERLEGLKADWDGSMAYLALLEGEATAVMLAALAEPSGLSFDSLVSSDQMVAALSTAASANPGVPAGTPPYFVSSMKFPYLEGLRFVIDTYRKGGWKAVDQLHASPPATTAQILHPETYSADHAPARANTRLVRNRRGVSLTLGEFHWRYLLGEQPAAGWESDRVEVIRSWRYRNSVLVDSWWKTDQDAREFRDAYLKFLLERGQTVWSSIEGSEVRIAYGARQRSLKRALRSRAWSLTAMKP